MTPEDEIMRQLLLAMQEDYGLLLASQASDHDNPIVKQTTNDEAHSVPLAALGGSLSNGIRELGSPLSD